MTVDLVIRGGEVIDGTGAARVRADVAVHDGRIVKIGSIDERGARELDAEGHVVTPGFVDAHTHMDAQVFWDPLGTSSSYHGVTTAVMGNCGFTLAPARAGARHLVVANLERAEDIPRSAMAEGIDWTWETFAEYLDAVERRPLGINYAAHIGHSALRTWAMGERAFTEPASADDLAAMRAELRAALGAGAIGFTTSRSRSHETADGRAVASRVAGWDEVCELVGVLAEAGTGVFQLAPEHAVLPMTPEDAALRSDVYARLRALATSTRVPIALPMPAAAGWRDAMRDIGAINAAGGRIFVLTHSRGVGLVVSFQTRLPFDQLDEWRSLRALPLARQHELLGRPDVRERLVAAAHHGPYGRAIGAEARPPDFQRMRVMRSGHLADPTVAEIAAQRGVDPVEAMIDLAVESDLRQLFVQPMLVEDPAEQVAVMRHPDAVMTFSDAGAHVSQIVDCSIQTHLLAHHVRETGSFGLEEAVSMITRAPAAAWGMRDRGVLRAGMAADINVLDPDVVAPAVPTVEHDLPGGSPRLVQRAVGFRATIVNGSVTFEGGEPTGERSGRLLRGPFRPR